MQFPSLSYIRQKKYLKLDKDSLMTNIYLNSYSPHFAIKSTAEKITQWQKYIQINPCWRASSRNSNELQQKNYLQTKAKNKDGSL